MVRAFLDSRYFQRVQFVWHGGEPLLLPPEYFWRTFEAQRKVFGYDLPLRNVVQTNLTVLDDARLEASVHFGAEARGLVGPPDAQAPGGACPFSTTTALGLACRAPHPHVTLSRRYATTSSTRRADIRIVASGSYEKS